VLNDFVASAIASERITILSDGTPWRPLIHVRDMARAIEWAVGRGGDGGNFVAVNVGSDEWNYQIRDLAEEVSGAIRGVDVSLASTAAPDPRSYRVSFERYRELAPDHQPQVELRAAVAELAEGLTSMGFADTEFRASHLVRLVVLQDLRDRGLLNAQLEWINGNGYRDRG
jgi:nucleoside-diphosphate-sugar epimerase